MEGLLLRTIKNNKGWLITLLVFALVAAIVMSMIISTTGKVTNAQAEQLKNALYSAAVNAYATSGSYPTLEELYSDYGIYADEEHFSVTYSSFASNILPYIDVKTKEE